MKILVDADACPVKAEIVEVAARHGIGVVMVASLAHDIQPAPQVEVRRVDKAPQATDIALVNEVRRGDVVVTDDYGLAGMALARGALVLTSRGRHLHDDNIDGLLTARHWQARARRGGHRSRGPAAFTRADAEHFRESLHRLLER